MNNDRFATGGRFLLVLFFFAVLPLIISAYTISVYQANQNLFAARSFSAFMIFHVAAIPAMAFALMPTTFIAVISGYFFSWWGLAGIIAAYPIAAILGLKVGRTINALILGDYVDRRPEIQTLIKRISRDEFAMIIFARLSPVLPFAMTNVALSALKLNLRTYVAATMIGMFPRTLLFFIAGKDAREIWAFLREPTFDGTFKIVPLILILVSTAGLAWVMKRAISRSVAAPNS